MSKDKRIEFPNGVSAKLAKSSEQFVSMGLAARAAAGATNGLASAVEIVSGEMSSPEFETHRKLLADIDRPVEPADGWRFCVDVTCGVELRDQHPTRACRKHREQRRTREGVKPLQTVTHPLTFFATIDQAARDDIAKQVARNRREASNV